MAFGFLKIASGIVGGVTKFIKNQQAKKSARLDKKAESIAASKLKLAGFLNGGATSNSGENGAPGLLGKYFSSQDAIKLSAIENSGGKASEKSVERGLTTEPKISEKMAIGINPIIWVVAAVSALFLLPKLLKK